MYLFINPDGNYRLYRARYIDGRPALGILDIIQYIRSPHCAFFHVESPEKSTSLHWNKMIDTIRNAFYRTVALGLLDLRSLMIKSTSVSAASTICSGGYWAFHPIKLPCRGVNVHLPKLISADLRRMQGRKVVHLLSTKKDWDHSGGDA